ncbi:unnamed protein product, partial [Rodentolepis nana]|uniref:Bestrophin homolog n=1 Tax=Rodentolepis nana TaxID=102285 RepID=A0A0R3T3B6_RODNA
VVTLAVYSYFVSAIIGRQFIVTNSVNSKPFRKDYYIPLYTILEFIVYMGWLKVAETLVNPMGEDDEDFDINAIIDSNWSYGMHMVDKRHQPTELVKDKFWNSANISLPHTSDSKKLQSTQMIGSVFNINVCESHEKSTNAASMASNRMSTESDDLDVPLEALGSRFKLCENADQQHFQNDHTSIPHGSQASIIQPQVPIPSDAGLPAVAEEDEDSSSLKNDTSQRENDDVEVEVDQTQTDISHVDQSQAQPQQEPQPEQQTKEPNVQPIPVIKINEVK